MALTSPMKTFVLSAIVATAALPALAQTEAEAEAQAALAAAFEAAGCRATPETSGDVLAASGLTDDRAIAAGQAMLEDGRLVATPDEVRYTAGACADNAGRPGPVGDPGLIAAVRGNGCVVTDAEAEAVLGPLGDLDATRTAVAALVQGGGAALVRVENALLLSEAVCAGGPMAAPYEAARLGAANLLMVQMQRWNCVAARGNVDRAFAEMSFADGDGLIAMLAVGGAVEDQGDFVGLTRAACLAAPGDLRRIVSTALGE